MKDVVVVRFDLEAEAELSLFEMVLKGLGML